MRSKIARVLLSDEKATAAFASRISPILSAGDTLLLDGQIGSGKSFFSRSLIRFIVGTKEDVPSPTFTLIQTYTGPMFDIWHCDLYRLSVPEEVFELGLEDAFSSALCLIEWANRLGEDSPQNALQLDFEVTEGRHFVTVAGDNTWCERLSNLNV